MPAKQFDLAMASLVGCIATDATLRATRGGKGLTSNEPQQLQTDTAAEGLSKHAMQGTV